MYFAVLLIEPEGELSDVTVQVLDTECVVDAA
jgi:hypothetical protein